MKKIYDWREDSEGNVYPVTEKEVVADIAEQHKDDVTGFIGECESKKISKEEIKDAVAEYFPEVPGLFGEVAE